MNTYLEPARIFISHSTADKAIARRISEALLERRAEIWRDDLELRAGDVLDTALTTAIGKSTYVLVLLTKHAVASQWVEREVAVAQALRDRDGGMRIVPCLIEDCEVPASLRGLLYADFRESFEAGMERLHDAVVAREVPTAGRNEHNAGYTIDHTIEWQFDEPGTKASFVKVVYSQAHPRDPWSIIGEVRFDASPALAERWRAMPESMASFRPLPFMSFAVGAIRQEQKAQGIELGLVLSGARETVRSVELFDNQRRHIATLTLRGRRLGHPPETDTAWYFGDLTCTLLEQFVANVGKTLNPEMARAAFRWLQAHPFAPGLVA